MQALIEDAAEKGRALPEPPFDLLLSWFGLSSDFDRQTSNGRAWSALRSTTFHTCMLQV